MGTPGHGHSQQREWKKNAKKVTATTTNVNKKNSIEMTSMPRETTGPKTHGVPQSTNMPSQQDNWRRHGQHTTSSTSSVQNKNTIQMTSHNRGNGGKVDTSSRNTSRQVLQQGFEDEAKRRAAEARQRRGR